MHLCMFRMHASAFIARNVIKIAAFNVRQWRQWMNHVVNLLHAVAWDLVRMAENICENHPVYKTCLCR